MSSFAQALSAALVDFIWQGAAVGAGLWLALRMLRGTSAQVRYAVSGGALIVLALLPCVTMAALWAPVAGGPSAVTASAGSSVPQVAAPQTLLTFWLEPDASRLAWLTIVQQWALPIWSIGVVILSVRLGLAYSRTVSLRRGTIPASEELCSLVSHVASRLGVERPVRLVLGSLTEGPCVLGWLRPVILMPPATAMGLTPQQLEAVLAHEVAHIHRNDYIVNVLQTIAETLFFYHPVVWWVSKQIREERELCCDDMAVKACGDPVGYARALTLLARQQLEQTFAAAATGGPLLHRVRRLVDGPRANDRSSQAPTALAAGLALAAVLVHLDWLQAQTAGPVTELPRFEVVSVKRNNLADGRIFNQYQNGRLTATGVSLNALIRSAYQVQEFQVVGGADWINRDRFDIVAKASAEDANARNRPGEPPRQALMLRALLADRFNLAVHKETREMPVYAIVLARKDGSPGSQLRRSTVNCEGILADRVRGEAPPAPTSGTPACSTSVAPGRVVARSRTMAQIATALSMLTNTGSSLNRLVVDRTGLQGNFDMDLAFTPENLPTFGPEGPPAGMPSIDPNGPSIFTAMQEQLGLKLESQRGPVDVLVLDRAELPTED